MARRRASSSSVSSFAEADALEARRANWSNFTDAANNGPRSPGKMGVSFSSTRSPHPKHSLSGAMLVKTASSSALRASPRKTISTMKMFAWKARPCSPSAPHGRPDIGSLFACVGHHCKRPMQCRGEARQTRSLKGQHVSKACFQFSFLESQQTRVR